MADRPKRSGVPSSRARASAVELADPHEASRRGIVTREYLDLARLRAGTERDIARLGLRIEGRADRALVWLGTIVGVSTATVGGLGVLF